MVRSVTYVVELLVGLACCGLGVVAWRHGRILRVGAVVFALAGVSAIAHAVLRLAQ
jgi:hypothetical protein